LQEAWPERGTGGKSPEAMLKASSSTFFDCDEALVKDLAKSYALGHEGGLMDSKSKHTEIATLAGGCFWGVEELLRATKGVVSTEVGYTGGSLPSPTYEMIKTGATGHTEGVQIEFNPQEISFEDLLRKFFKLHDPTTPNRQGNDIGNQYRSVIFYHGDEQKLTATKVRALVDQSGAWKRPVVTEIVPAMPFYPAEEYHQKYLIKNPGGYTCHYIRDYKF